MANEEETTSIVAIVIALIAFFVAFAQFLLQASGTIGVGARRCQPSVMGQWAKTRKYRWVWRELRWETTFSTPDFHLLSIQSSLEDCDSESQILINGSELSRLKSFSEKPKDSNGESDLGRRVSWIAFLDQLHEIQNLLLAANINEGPTWSNLQGARAIGTENYSTICCPAITLHAESWDFMPPDLVRPVASSTVGDIIALGHRLGMEWKELRPAEGIMRAEGNGQSIVSMGIGGLGTVLQYIPDESRGGPRCSLRRFGTQESKHGVGYEVRTQDETWAHLTIPSQEADKLGFGIISGIKELSIPDFIFSGRTNFARS